MKSINPIYAERRRRLAQAMKKAGSGVAVLFSGAEVMRNRDADYPFRWDSYFYYLTGFPEPDAALVIITTDSEPRALLFCREKNEEREIWDGFRYGPEAAAEVFGFDDAFTIGEARLQDYGRTGQSNRHLLSAWSERRDRPAGSRLARPGASASAIRHHSASAGSSCPSNSG